MHEASLINDLVQKINAIVIEQDGKRAVAIKVKLGALSHISSEHLREHFEVASKHTLAEGATLECESSKDLSDPLAQEILLESVEVEV
ncbi:MAG: hydrogenase maturation nickel metallochaperone HypA [Cyanobacteriota bacterium]|jgi:hydrogenase nickel incorporation protein HypA/HybF|nr:hydrogenase maturation nickel metallochaperone HypA [Cyanobacteriota bacterium]